MLSDSFLVLLLFKRLFYLVHLLYIYYYLPIIFLPFTTYIPLFNRLCSWERGT